MTEKKTDNVFVEGTQFYRKSALSDVFRVSLIVFVGFLVIAVFAGWVVVDAGARRAHKEARDIRRALRTVGTEYYGERSSIYDPSKVNGLADGAAERIAQQSTRRGEVILYSWDGDRNIPLQFEYRNGLYRVVYTDSSDYGDVGDGVEGDFRVYYSFELLKFEGE